MAHFVKPLKAGNDVYKKKTDGSLSSMTIAKSGTKSTVVVWGGGRSGDVLSLVAFDSSGNVLAKTRLLGVEKGHAPDPDGDDQWFMLYEVEPLADGVGTLTAVDKAGMPFARIALTVGSGGKRALIMIPSQGQDVIAFQSVAWKLTTDVYGGQATTIRSKISGGRNFYFMKADGKPYPIGAESNLSTIIIISHSAADGPNLAFRDKDPALSVSDDGSDHQPLMLDDNEKSANARAFWAAAGHALNGAGKLILLGCEGNFFAPKIAPVVGRRIYALQGSTHAGDVEFSLRHVKAIEKGSPVPPMKQFNP